MVTPLGELVDALEQLEEDIISQPSNYDDLFDGLQECIVFGQELLANQRRKPRRRGTRKMRESGRIMSGNRRKLGRNPAGMRKPSAWNTFVKTEMPKVLKKHPRFTPQRAMKEVSRRWKSSPKNPNRRGKR